MSVYLFGLFKPSRAGFGIEKHYAGTGPNLRVKGEHRAEFTLKVAKDEYHVWYML